jgi:hypothetical protein
MTKAKWYTPQLSREIVSRLYNKAKADGIPMTTLANRIVEQALDADHGTEMPILNKGMNGHDRK